LDTTPKTKAARTKTKRWSYIKLLILFIAKHQTNNLFHSKGNSRAKTATYKTREYIYKDYTKVFNIKNIERTPIIKQQKPK
jgi:hypothetical protein